MSKATCKFPECDRRDLYGGVGYCKKHHRAYKRHGPDFSGYQPNRPKGTSCIVEGCDEKVRSNDYCRKHYMNHYRHGPVALEPPGGCSVEGCEKLVRSIAKGLCRGHSQMLAMYGTTDSAEAAKIRFEKHYEVADTGCWEWTGAKNPRGYGETSDKSTGRENVYAHRMAWELYRADIPEGLTIDHLCRNTSCVNPDHLEPVTFEENQRRRGASVTHCPRGHEYTPENTYRRDGMRNCRACARVRSRERRAAS